MYNYLYNLKFRERKFNFAIHLRGGYSIMAVLKVVLLAIVIMALVLVGLALQMLFKKGGTFPNTHIGSNKYMKDNGVTCAQTFDKIEQAKARKEFRFKQLSLDESETKYFC